MSDFISKAHLKSEYHFTDALIKQLGMPDATRPNPHFRNAAPMQLYDRTRVEQWIAEHPALVDQARQRQVQARKAVETKRQRAQAIVDEWLKQVEFRQTPPPAVLTQHVYDHLLSIYQHGNATDSAIASYIRHNYTNYETLLMRLRGKVGNRDLYHQIKTAINQRIAEHYGYQYKARDYWFEDGWYTREESDQ